MFAIYCVVPLVAILIGIRKYREKKWGKCDNREVLSGKIAIVTGGNSGIGYEVVKELALRKAQVILACRNLNNAKQAIAKIQSQLKGEAQLIPMSLDLASIESINDFAREILRNYTRIDLLINNAGVALSRKGQRELTSDGFEKHFGINHIGHFHLTNLLLDVLKKSQECRIVIVTSSLHEKATIDLDNLNLETSNGKLYANSKLANVYFCRELAKRVEDYNIRVYAVCPGWCYTNLFRHSFKWYHYILIGPIAFFFMRSAKQGAQTVIYCATEPKLINETGLLYRDCKRYDSKHNFDDETQLKLWEASEKCFSLIQK